MTSEIVYLTTSIVNLTTAINDISTSINGFSTSPPADELAKAPRRDSKKESRRGYEEKSYSPLPCIQALTLWPMRWVKARLKVL